MKTTLRRALQMAKLLFILALIIPSGLASASMPEEQGFFEQLADGVYLHRGKHAGIDDPERADSANIGLGEGEAGVAVSDTGGAMTTGERGRDASKASTTTPSG